MPNKRPLEPIAPANIPGQALDPKIPPDQRADGDETFDDRDDDVGAGEAGNEILSATPTGTMPDVNSDRDLEPNSAPGNPAGRRKAAPLEIGDIEKLEDDAKGG